MNPSTNTFDGMTAAGQSFSDPGGGLTFSVMSIDTTQATIQVTYTRLGRGADLHRRHHAGRRRGRSTAAGDDGDGRRGRRRLVGRRRRDERRFWRRRSRRRGRRRDDGNRGARRHRRQHGECRNRGPRGHDGCGRHDGNGRHDGERRHDGRSRHHGDRRHDGQRRHDGRRGHDGHARERPGDLDLGSRARPAPARVEARRPADRPPSPASAERRRAGHPAKRPVRSSAGARVRRRRRDGDAVAGLDRAWYGRGSSSQAHDVAKARPRATDAARRRAPDRPRGSERPAS